MTTTLLFRDDAYLRDCEAKVLGINERGGIVLDRTVFYAQGGGQPGDVGTMTLADGTEIPIATTVWDNPEKTMVAHVPAAGSPVPATGDSVRLALDWPLRFRRMRMHTALHLLSVALPYPVTGGSVNEDESRLDFDIPEAGLDKDTIAAEVNRLIASDAAVTESWITDAELDANPGLVKTMSVKPPRGSGRVRLVKIEGIDLQPCGGTHVRHLGEIGPVLITQIEKKGKQNRRVRLRLA
jgi:misacylated tRNA(Ala) deacylase